MADHNNTAARPRPKRRRPSIFTWRVVLEEHRRIFLKDGRPPYAVIGLSTAALILAVLVGRNVQTAQTVEGVAFLVALIAVAILGFILVGTKATENLRLNALRTPGKFFVDVILNEWDDRSPDGKIESVTKWQNNWPTSIATHEKQIRKLSAQDAAAMRTMLPKLQGIQVKGKALGANGLLRVSKLGEEPERWRFECVRQPLIGWSLALLHWFLRAVFAAMFAALIFGPGLYFKTFDLIEIGILIAGLAIFFLFGIVVRAVTLWRRVAAEQFMTIEIEDDIMEAEWTEHHKYLGGTHRYKAWLSGAVRFGELCQRLLDLQTTAQALLSCNLNLLEPTRAFNAQAAGSEELPAATAQGSATGELEQAA